MDINGASDLHASDLAVSGNSAASSVSGVSVSDAGLRVTSVTNVTGNRWNVSNNSVVGDSTAGGNFAGFSVQNSAGSVVLRDISVIGNTCSSASSCAAGFYNNACVDIKGFLSRNNVATKTGTAWTGNSGIAVGNNTSFRLSDADITGNVTGDNEIVALRASFTDFTGNPPVARSPFPPLTNSVLIENSSIYGNTAQAFIVYATTPGVYTLRNVSVSGNTALGGGGGLNYGAYAPFSAADAHKFVVQNSTISRNAAQSSVAIGMAASTGSGSGAVNGSLVGQSSILGRQTANNTALVMNVADASKVTLTNSLV